MSQATSSISTALFGGLMVIALTVMYGVALNNQLLDDLAQQMDSAAQQAEARHKQ